MTIVSITNTWRTVGQRFRLQPGHHTEAVKQSVRLEDFQQVRDVPLGSLRLGAARQQPHGLNRKLLERGACCFGGVGVQLDHRFRNSGRLHVLKL
eukprot:6389319-Pyramimonas_sp.AAC.1